MKLLLAAITLIFPFASAAIAKAPNIVFIFVDDQAWSGTSVPMIPGKESSRTAGFQMPNVDRLAAQGMVFSQAYAGHPKCECSRASLLMGRTTTSLNAVDKRSRTWNAPPADSLANTLKRANPNYRAAHFGKWQWPTPPEEFGYDASDGVTMNEDGDSRDPEDPKQSFGITRRAQDYMEKQVKEGHPFYLQLSYYAVHTQPQALASTLKKYEGTSVGGGRGKGGGAIVAAMTEDLDTCIGILLNDLQALGIAKDTYIIYTSDNGGRTEALKGGKALCDEGGIRVPLIVQGPGIRGGTYCNEPAVGYDILPTVLDFAAPGFALPKGVEGGSWKPVLMSGGTGKVQRPIDRLVWHHDVEIEHPQTALRKETSSCCTTGTRRKTSSTTSPPISVNAPISPRRSPPSLRNSSTNSRRTCAPAWVRRSSPRWRPGSLSRARGHPVVRAEASARRDAARRRSEAGELSARWPM